MNEYDWIDKKTADHPQKTERYLLNLSAVSIIIFCLWAFMFFRTYMDKAYIFLVIIFLSVLVITYDLWFHRLLKKFKPVRITDNKLLFVYYGKDVSLSFDDIKKITTKKYNRIISILLLLNMVININNRVNKDSWEIFYKKMLEKEIFCINTNIKSYSLMITDEEGFKKVLIKKGIEISR